MKWYYENGAAKRHPTIFGYRRRTVLIVLAIALSLLILIIGLAVGLTIRKHNSTFFLPHLYALMNSPLNLPLPGDTGGIFSGDLTYYGTGLGSCGIDSKDTDMICAISHQLYGFSPHLP